MYVQNWWGYFKDEILKACDEMCGRKMWRRSKGDAWWWNEEVKETMSRKTHKAMCRNSIEENKKRYRNNAKKAVSRELRETAEDVLSEL